MRAHREAISAMKRLFESCDEEKKCNIGFGSPNNLHYRTGRGIVMEVWEDDGQPYALVRLWTPLGGVRLLHHSFTSDIMAVSRRVMSRISEEMGTLLDVTHNVRCHKVIAWPDESIQHRTKDDETLPDPFQGRVSLLPSDQCRSDEGFGHVHQFHFRKDEAIFSLITDNKNAF